MKKNLKQRIIDEMVDQPIPLEVEIQIELNRVGAYYSLDAIREKIKEFTQVTPSVKHR